VVVGAGGAVGVISAGAAITLGAGSTYYSTPIDAVVTEGAGSGPINSQPVYVDGGGIVDTVNMQAAMDAINLKLNSNQVGNNLVETYTDLSDQSIGDGGDTTIYFSAINLQANTELEIRGNVTVITSEAMTMGAGAEIKLEEGAQVTWILGGSLNLGAGSTFSGETYVKGAVNGATSDVECGNLYASGAVSIRTIGNTCERPILCPAFTVAELETFSIDDSKIHIGSNHIDFGGYKDGESRFIFIEDIMTSANGRFMEMSTNDSWNDSFYSGDTTIEQHKKCVTLLTDEINNRQSTHI
jgi:hypothetical protein